MFIAKETGHIHKNVVMKTTKGTIFIKEIADQLSSKMQECLPFAQAVSRCDTISAR